MTSNPCYPVTELELRQIQNDCKYPHTINCDGCDCFDKDVFCTFSANILIDDIKKRFIEPAPTAKPQQNEPSGNSRQLEEIVGEIHGLTFLAATQTGNEHAVKACNLSADLLRQQKARR